MKKIKIKTNRGWWFDFWVNLEINSELKKLGIEDNVDLACRVAANIFKKYKIFGQ